MRILGQPEPSHERERLLGAAKRAGPRRVPKDLGDGQSIPREDKAGQQRAGHEYEMHDWNRKSHEGNAEGGAEYDTRPFQSIGPREHRNVHDRGGRGRAESLQLYRDLTYFH